MNVRAALGFGLVLGVAGSVLVGLARWSVPPTVPAASVYRDVLSGSDAVEPLAKPASVLRASSQPSANRESAAVFESEPVRIVIAAINVSAPIVEMGLTPGGALDAPSDPDLVAWYGFTGRPGAGGNAVMSGHLDYVRHVPAVFWDLRRLGIGDRVSVELADGNAVVYRVVAAESYLVEAVPMADVVAPTERDVLTLITCGGAFESGEYRERLVVKAAREP